MPARVGVLALQGDFEAHGKVLRALGAEVAELRALADFEGLDALIIPGGESTTMTLGIEREGIAGALREHCRRVPVLGTCAGMIMLDREHLGVLENYDLLSKADVLAEVPAAPAPQPDQSDDQTPPDNGGGSL